MVPNNENKKEIIHTSMIVTFDEITLIPKKWWKEKLFLSNQSIIVIYPYKETVFMVPNHEKKRRLICESVFVQINI